MFHVAALTPEIRKFLFRIALPRDGPYIHLRLSES